MLHWPDIARETGNRSGRFVAYRNLIRAPTTCDTKPALHLPRASRHFDAMENAMTPQERQLIDDLFDRLAKLEGSQRDPEAMSAIMQGLRQAPNAVYALVQTALVQDEALRRANSRIQELEAGHGGEQNQSGGFLDSMRDAIFGQNQPQGSQRQGSVPNVRAPGISDRPVWNSDLAREAGINDIGSSGNSRAGLFGNNDDNSRAGFFDSASNDDDDSDHDSDGFDSDGDSDDA